ncbi:hypothetical protein BGZ70_008401 [Mortierella alpina]|uniref:Cytochrome P450 n=1 Tax=Mortierella alpina TaxID=64518 RepID=A0A9P6M5Y1_MORAP|nr:hypothetical protein BGZ70_008401 [Mortierella alpina]
MLGLISTTPGPDSANILQAALPIGLGLASTAYLAMRMMRRNETLGEKSIPCAAIRTGDATHDAEYREDPDRFLSTCQKRYGPVFNCSILNQRLTVVSGPMVREVFMSQHFSFMDAIDDITGLRAFTTSVIKSNQHPDSRVVHEIVRDLVTPNLPLFTPLIVERVRSTLESRLGVCDHKLVENPQPIFADMIAGAMATVFMGSEIAQNRTVLDSFIYCTYDFGRAIGPEAREWTWGRLYSRIKYGMWNPLQKHVQVLVQAATPVVLERRRQAAEASEQGLAYKAPLDILQMLLDNFDQYGLVDLEDICGHLLLLVLASVHTSSDASTCLNYYLAAFPEHMEMLYQEQTEVLNQVAKEREQQRQKELQLGTVRSVRDFEGTELDPRNDRELSATVLKRLTRMDTFIREMMRFRCERLSLEHKARQDVVLSNGMVIPKGSKAIINMASVHQNAEVQGEDPTEFQPWRFIGKAKTATKVSSEFLPFGIGRHSCPGRFLAIQELKTVGALMVSQYSKIQFQDPSKKMQALLSAVGAPMPTGLVFTSRVTRVASD